MEERLAWALPLGRSFLPELRNPRSLPGQLEWMRRGGNGMPQNLVGVGLFYNLFTDCWHTIVTILSGCLGIVVVKDPFLLHCR